MKRFISAAAVSLLLAGCAGYQFGDASKMMLQKQAEYCATADPEVRAAALAAIRLKVPAYPASGLCSDAEQALAKAIADRMADLPDGAVIDIEQARKDQERFE